jgi:MFS family permease
MIATQPHHKRARLQSRADGKLLAALAPVSALLLSVSMLLMGNGLQGTLVPVRGNMESFLPFELGLLGAAYFIGFTLGCLQGPVLVRRAGHIRAYLAMTSLASAVAVLHPVFIDPFVWSFQRAVTGYCFAVLYIVIESWLNERADNEMRGTVFSVYTIINLTVLTAGQMMLGLADPNSFALFALASILVSVAALPVAFTGAVTPAAVQLVKPRLRKLYRISPVGVAGCLAVGLANGSFWALGPVFAQNIGLNTAGIGFFMSAVVLGGAVSQWPLGRLSDRMDRRIVMIVAALIALGAAIALMLIPEHDRTSMIIAGAIFGAGAFPIYPLAVAQANDYADRAEFVEVSSGLLLVFGIGAAIGPLLASLVREVALVPTLFFFTAAVHAVLIAYVIWRMTQRAAPAEDERGIFSDAVIAAQTVTPFDPIAASEMAAESTGAAPEARP